MVHQGTTGSSKLRDGPIMNLICTHVPCYQYKHKGPELSIEFLTLGVTPVGAAVPRSTFSLDYSLLVSRVRSHVGQLVLARTWCASVRELFKLITLILFSRDLEL